MTRYRPRSIVLAIAVGCGAVLLAGQAGTTLADSPPLQSALAAAPADVASGHVALRAYRRFLGGLAADIPAWRRADDTFVASISKSCPNVLAAINFLPGGSVNRSALTAFVEELGSDLEAVSRVPDRAPLAKMAKTLARLRWSRHRTRVKTKRYLSSERGLFGLAPSDLCADAQALAASNAQTTPPGTLQWLASYARDAKRAGAGTAAFVQILERFHSQADRPEIDAINHLANRLRSADKALLTAELPRLLSALGISG